MHRLDWAYNTLIANYTQPIVFLSKVPKISEALANLASNSMSEMCESSVTPFASSLLRAKSI